MSHLFCLIARGPSHIVKPKLNKKWGLNAGFKRILWRLKTRLYISKSTLDWLHAVEAARLNLSSVHAFTASIPFSLQSPAFWQWSWDSLPQDSSGRLFLLWAQEWTTHLKFKQLIAMVSSWAISIWMFTLIIGRFRKAVGPWHSFEGAGPNKTDSSILEAKLLFYVGFRAGFRIFHVDFRSRSKILIRFLSPDP